MRSWPFLMALLLVPAAVMAAEPTSSSPTASFKVLEAAHAEPGSMFMEVDGLRVHYVDEGLREAGAPAVLMLNASYTNLSSWRGVAERLRGGHRVIRLDFPTVGLSGGPGGPAADAMLDIRAFEGLVLGVMDRLGVTQVTLVGTSSGAIVAFRLAAAHPERVTRLVLLNAAGLPRTAATDPLRARVRAADAPPVGSLGFWRESLEANFSQASRVSDDLVRYVYDMNRRAEQDREGRVFMKTFATGDPQGVLGRITMPTLILWGKKGVTLSHLEAEVFQGWLTRAPVMIRKYEDAGHYPQMEQPGAVAGDIAAFVAGEMDARLRPAPGVMAATLAEVPFWQANAGLWLGEDVYMTGAGEPKIKGYANLTETRLEAAAMEEEEYRFYPPSEMATAMAGGLLRAGEGVEVRRLLKGQMADAGGRVMLLPEFNGQGAGKTVEMQPLTDGSGLMTVRAETGGLDSYRVHVDITAPDRRIRNTMGLEPDGSLRAIALYREVRRAAGEKAALLKELRARFRVAVIVEGGPDGRPVARRAE